MGRQRRAYREMRPQFREGENGRVSTKWRSLFLDYLAETSNVTEAAKRCGANPSRAYKLRRTDPEFARQWRDALLEGYEHLELETLRRLREGVPPDGPKFDIANALRLLALHRETVARERARIENSDEASVLASLNRKLEAMRQNELALAGRKRAKPDRTHEAGA